MPELGIVEPSQLHPQISYSINIPSLMLNNLHQSLATRNVLVLVPMFFAALRVWHLATDRYRVPKLRTYLLEIV